ncbi:hypothetical protein IAE22_37355 [Bacillus sp. S34]|nr:hypothetical protein [Bacillus sp. S34]
MIQTLDGSGPFASVDEIAATVSNYPHTINGRTLSITEEGAQEALDCLAKS